MSTPRTVMIKRNGEKTEPEGFDPATAKPADWTQWPGETFVFASKPGARKTGALKQEPHCSVAIDLETMHLVVEGSANRLTQESDLRRATLAFDERFSWPTEVDGDLIDSPYAAPSSGGPPFEVYEIRPTRAYAFPTSDQFEPTRWEWD